MQEPFSSETTALISSDTSDINSKDALEERYHQFNLSLPKLPIVTSLWLGSFLVALDGTIVANTMNRIAEEFEESDKQQWIATSFLLTNTAFQPLYGKLSDITGRRFALITAQFFFGLGCLLTCFSRTLTEFAIARAVCGVGGGGISAMSSITVSDICTAKERGVYQGYANLVFGTGQLLGAPLGGVAITIVGWRAVFAVQVPLVAVCMILGQRNVKVKLSHIPPPEERFTLKNLSRLDLLGSIALVISISGLLFICSTDVNKVLLTLITCISFAVFIVNEVYWAPERIMPFELLKGTFGLASLATVASSFLVFGDIFRSPIYLQTVQNISPSRSGVFILFGSIGCATASLVTGWTLRHTKGNMGLCAYRIVLMAVCLQLAGLVLTSLVISFVAPNQTLYSVLTNGSALSSEYYLESSRIGWKLVYVVGLVLNSYGYGGLLVSTLVSIVFSIDKSQQATVTGIFYLWRSLGNVLGTSLTLSLYQNALKSKLWTYMSNHGLLSQYEYLLHDTSYLRKHFDSDQLAGLLDMYRDAFLLSYIPNAAIALVAVILSWSLVRVYKRSLKYQS
ncbi:LAMI_0G04346g1_1 [Lachancea mirantina]|uniref:LAMI_0G04346g1_1 n=1 Tax=Lachancea mirantina TaxID=1230905 RepID=A0A1G4K8F4_9SACH|nr:LAMI_0G04346g1_1 [Lachancea mirantina]